MGIVNPVQHHLRSSKKALLVLKVSPTLPIIYQLVRLPEM